MMTQGIDNVRKHIERIKNDPESTDKDEDLLTTLEACYEFYLRGLEFAPIDIYKSHATKFNLEDGKLLPPGISWSAARASTLSPSRSSARPAPRCLRLIWIFCGHWEHLAICRKRLRSRCSSIHTFLLPAGMGILVGSLAILEHPAKRIWERGRISAKSILQNTLSYDNILANERK